MNLRTYTLRIFIFTQDFPVEHIESINRESMSILNKMEDILKTNGELKMNADIFDMNHDLVTESLQKEVGNISHQFRLEIVTKIKALMAPKSF